MRKWMRERLQRGKKKAAEPSDQPAPPPLQPAYFEAEQASNAADAGRTEPEISIQPEPSPEPPSEHRPVQRARPASGEPAEPASEQPSSEEQPAARESG